MGAFGLLVGSGWASGINLYLVALMLGVASRIGWGDAPDFFGRTEVMVVAGVLFAVEFFVDKVPYLDNLWDTAHTVIRPLGAAATGFLVSGDAPSAMTVAGAVASGALALNAHAAKASTRVAVNASPEPVSNIVVSIFEDGLVAALVALALTFPVITTIVVIVLVVSAGTLTILLFRKVRGAWRGLRARVRSVRR